MKFSLLVCVVLSVVLSILFVEVTSQTVSCESIASANWGAMYGSLKTCFMKTTTTIDSDGFVISLADSSVEAINFDSNKNIHFLPIGISETFPNIVAYSAAFCSIKTISKKNFVNLKKLKYLDLGNNQIERIDSDTFADSTLLEVIWLDGNKIKQINGEAFRGLNRLTTVYLRSNICIDKHYGTPAAIATLTREVTESCGFAEVEQTTENIANVVQGLNVSMEKLTKENRECLVVKLETAASAATMSAENLALTSQLKISEDAKLGLQAENEAFKLQIEALKLQLKAADEQQAEGKSSQQVEIAVLKATLKAAEDAKSAQLKVSEDSMLVLKTSLKACEDAKSEKQAENMATISMLTQLAASLATCIEKTKELSETVEMKLEEISGLLEEQATNRAAMKEKTAEIALLRKTLEDLNRN